MSSKKKVTKGGFNFSKVWRMAVLALGDAVLINLSGILALFIRFDFEFRTVISSEYFANLIQFIPVSVVLIIAMFFCFKLYSSVWEFAGLKEGIKIGLAVAATTSLQFILMYIFRIMMPRSFVILNFLILCVLEATFRLSYRFLRDFKAKINRRGVRTMIVGAGQTGAMALRELQNNSHSENRTVCFVDDNPALWGRYINGIRIVGGTESIKDAVKKYRIKEIILALPHATAQKRREHLEVCQETGCRLRIVPAVYQLASGEVCIQEIRNVEVEDLLGREAVKVNLDEIAGYVSGKTVLVTGGGGSIGSELCRQIAKQKPQRLIIFDIYENNAYDIQQELLKSDDCPPLEVLIGSVRDEARVNNIFETYHPDIIYHAAAHKHVPLMEDSPNEAIKNNVFGTYNVAKAADKYGASTMVLISTDKAVNPTNVMGASKRMCEMIVQTFAKTSKIRFVAVRFGNVLGSNGSVIPLFRRQIAAGGPVTVTHKNIIRFFMTIPEAVSLVLQAGAYAKGGEVFVLDMGKPVKIYDLAVNMIKLSGFKPFEDIDIEITGLRPGEKLYEEILMSEEGLDKTENSLIFIGHPNDFDSDALAEKLEVLKSEAANNSTDIVRLIAETVPTFHPENAGAKIPAGGGRPAAEMKSGEPVTV